MAHHEDLSQRKTFSIITKNSRKESNKNPINWELNDSKAGQVTSLTASPTKLPSSPQKDLGKQQEQPAVVKETDDYEEDQEDMESSMKDS